jgi:cellulose 1,4-beta-cellobiosidase
MTSGPFTALVTGLTSTSYVDTGLINGTTYYYQLTAVDAAGQSSPSAVESATPTAMPPEAPTNLIVVSVSP